MTTEQWILIALVLVLIIAYPILMSRRNKKENERIVEQTNSLKRGDKILTTSGVYGTILEVREEDGAKKVVIETGNAQYKSYMTIDAYAIYTVLKDEKELAKEAAAKTEKEAKAEKVVEEKKEEAKVEAKAEEKPAEKKPAAKKAAKAPAKKSTKKESK